MYVRHIVAVFREVRRVLRDDGTLWLNLGDSYATGGGSVGECPGGGAQGERWKGYRGGHDDDPKQRRDDRKGRGTPKVPAGSPHGTGQIQPLGPRVQPNRMPIAGLKPKDLCGIPWRVAFALQAPYVKPHNIKRETDRAWLAALVDGEGCISVRRYDSHSNGLDNPRCQDGFVPFICIGNNDRALLDRCVEITGYGKVGIKDRPGTDDRGIKSRRDYYGWRLDGNKAIDVIREIYPYIIAKRRQAILAYTLDVSNKAGKELRGNGTLPADEQAKRERIKELVNLCNQRAPVDMPSWCIEPPLNEVEPGWYLRSDIVWNKPSCLPESVRDRPTKSHEYLFMFSKSERYYYDSDAIKEPVKLDTPARYDRGRGEQHKWADGGPTGQSITSDSHYKKMASKSGNKRKTWGNNETIDRAEGEGVIETHRGIPWEGDMRNRRTVWEVEDESGTLAQVLAFLAERHPAALFDLEDAYRHKTDVWTVLARGYPGAHFATYPPMLIAPCILAGCPPAGKRCDCEEIINTPIGEGEQEDPSLTVGRAGLSRPRKEEEGTRPTTRREQRAYAKQMKASPHRAEMAEACGPAFAHYIRTDRAGARPLPDAFFYLFLKAGWLTPAGPCDCPEEPAGTVLDPFVGSGTTLRTANGLCRNAIGIDLKADYIELAEEPQATLDMG